MKQVAQILTRDEDTRICILSAVAGVTNKLVSFAQESARRGDLFQDICLQHRKIAHDLEIEDLSGGDLKALFEGLESFMASSLTPAQFDEVLSFGERLSTTLMYHYLKAQGHPIVFWDARHFIVTDDHFGKATPFPDQISEKMKAALSQLQGHELIITQGFIGATAQGKTTTVGRGGSDYTAALFAEGLKAEQLNIYTDVQGVFTMDPNRVAGAKFIPHLGFQEMAELANFGAKILHPATLSPCFRANIPVVIGSTFEPNAGHTLVTALSPKPLDKKVPVQAIAMRKDQILLTIKSLHMLNVHGFLANIFTILSNHKVSIDVITTSEVSVALTVDGSLNHAHGNHPFSNPELLEELKAFADVAVEENLTLVTLVGPNLSQHAGALQSVIGAMDHVPIRLICQGASASNISFLIPATHATDVVSNLHQQFIES